MPLTVWGRRRWRREHRDAVPPWPGATGDLFDEEITLALDTTRFDEHMRALEAAYRERDRWLEERARRFDRAWQRGRAALVAWLFGQPPPSEN